MLGDPLEAGTPGDLGDDSEPYCTTCGEWAGMFASGLEGWHHFRGDPSPGGVRTLYDADHEAVIGWRQPAGASRTESGTEPGGGAYLAPEDVRTVLSALSDASWYRANHSDAGDAALAGGMLGGPPAGR